jgi:hypothetical protein
MAIVIQRDDTTGCEEGITEECGKKYYRRNPHREMRGMLLKRLSADTTLFDTQLSSISKWYGAYPVNDSTEYRDMIL